MWGWPSDRRTYTFQPPPLFLPKTPLEKTDEHKTQTNSTQIKSDKEGCFPHWDKTCHDENDKDSGHTQKNNEKKQEEKYSGGLKG